MVRDSSFGSLTLFSATVFLLLQGLLAQRVKVEPEVVSYPGGTVTLRCAFPDPGKTQLTQVSWIIEKSAESRTNIAVYHPTYGPSYPDTSPVYGRVSFNEPVSLDNPSIQINDIKLTDAGKYVCEYATYPSGNEKGATSLVILAKPMNSASSITVPAGTSSVAVAKCESANGRPAAAISWSTPVTGNATTPVKTENSDNTVTMRSEYWIVPTPADNGKDISCVVAHRTQSRDEIIPLKLVIEYPPQVKITGYDDNWYIGRTNVVLTCQAEGNPIPTTVTWKTSSGLLPASVQTNQNQLTVPTVDEVVNSTFICEVTNRLGTGKDQVTTFIREAPIAASNAGVVAGAIIGSLLAVLLVAGLISILVIRNRRQQQGYRGNSKANAPYNPVSRLFGSSGSKNGGTGNHGNNNAPIYKGEMGLSEKEANLGLHPGGMAVVENTPTAQDILLSNELDEAERRKFDELEDDERYDQFRGSGPILQIRPHDEVPNSTYLDDDMESQRDGSIISRTAVYV